MLKQLGKGITIINASAFIVVILVGAISIFFTQNILHNAYKVQSVSKDIIITDSIHADIYFLIRNIHHFLLEEDDLSSQEALKLVDNIKRKVEDYREHELGEGKISINPEIEYLDRVLENIDKLQIIKKIINDFYLTGKYNMDDLMELEEYAYDIEEISDEINTLHLIKIGNWVDNSLLNMWKIMFIYLVIIILGGISIYAGHRALLKNIVVPIKTLAAATLDFAEGRLHKRVKTESQTEIGTLYQSFNEMAEKLQENDKSLRMFNEELENKVNERTYELQDANQKLRKTSDALIRAERIAAVGQIASAVTHEIKNPLNSLAINTQMLLKDISENFDANSPALESASLIKFEINRINNILEEFVKFARFPEPSFFKNNLNQVIEEVIDLISDNVKESNVIIKQSLQKDIPDFQFDARQFKEIFINLFQNAISEMKDGGTIEIETKLENDKIIIHVSDTGKGISEKNLNSIFTPFFSTKEGGLGLGLPIVQKIVESHGGIINCESKVGEGTDFEIILPLERG